MVCNFVRSQVVATPRVPSTNRLRRARPAGLLAMTFIVLLAAPLKPLAGADFIRGDATADGTLNISDAIFTLSYLVLGGAPPPCMDGADIDDNGAVNIVDPVQLLHFLFAGFAMPAPPFPNCGNDPTMDVLDCASHAFCP
ncbi:MAG: hypothetical protein AAF581_03090 [Planctomycetota bacterium]